MSNRPECLKPSLSLLVKLGSLAVHIDEFLSDDGHEYDKIAIQTALTDAELREWISQMTKLAMLPVKRRSTP